MKKASFALLVVINFILAGFVGFLAWQVSQMHEATLKRQNKDQTVLVNSQKLAAELDGFKADLKEQKEALQEFSAKLATLPDDLKKQLSQNFVSLPKAEIEEPLFQIKANEDGSVKVVGDKKAVQAWLARNELYRDMIFSKSITLRQETGGLIVEQIQPLSLFGQMGFKTGDKILTINGKAVSAPQDALTELAKPESATITLMRDSAQRTLALSYEDPTEEKAAAPSSPQ